MTLFYTFIILFLVAIALFMGQIAIQFIKLERKVDETVETLEEELIDVFGMQPVSNPEPAKKPLTPPPSPPPPPKPPKPGKKA